MSPFPIVYTFLFLKQYIIMDVGTISVTFFSAVKNSVTEEHCHHVAQFEWHPYEQKDNL